MFVIDLKTVGFENHEAVARFLGDNLTRSAKEHCRTWVIHLFCPNRSWPQNLGPVGIVILMLYSYRPSSPAKQIQGVTSGVHSKLSTNRPRQQVEKMLTKRPWKS